MKDIAKLIRRFVGILLLSMILVIALNMNLSPSWDYDFIKNAPYLLLVVIGGNVFLLFLIYMIANAKLLKSVKSITKGRSEICKGKRPQGRELDFRCLSRHPHAAFYGYGVCRTD